MKYTREMAENEAIILLQTRGLHYLMDKSRLNCCKKSSDNPKTYIANLIYKNYNIGVYMLITKENEPDMASIFAVSGRESEREEEEDETET